jgi:predicted nucleic acid-binding protein
MPRLYLDTCCFNRPYDDQSQERVHVEAEAVLLILTNVAVRSWELVGSDVIDLEVARIRDQTRRTRVQRMARAGTIHVRVDGKHILRGVELEALGFSELDALHIACAEAAAADVLVTADDDMVRRSRRLKSSMYVRVANPATWMQEENLR